MRRDATAAAEFQRIHDSNAWGSAQSRSGRGSEDIQTAYLQTELPALFQRLGVQSILDAPCGDFHWMSGVPMGGVHYTGVDIVPALVENTRARYESQNPQRQFVCRNIIEDPLPKADLIFCRDCLVHLPLKDIWRAIENFRRSGATYLLTTTFPGHDRKNANWDIAVGDWRALNLLEPPFRFPKPVELINERCSEGDGEFRDKSLGLWRLSDLPAGPS